MSQLLHGVWTIKGEFGNSIFFLYLQLLIRFIYWFGNYIIFLYLELVVRQI
ncbi:unnamed protein product [Meloidogyne enterolobii]|uniref:Uncharacterized protein n=1 Tax=Meloidogyne enterolobii TaxID=390850 RepID=A0ACB0ZV66_MELEN